MSTSKFTSGNKINPNKGGKEAIERLVKAYGFSTRQALCDHLGVSKSTLANRYMRDTFPSDWIIQCALETGMSLDWLAFGIGEYEEQSRNEIFKLQKFLLIQGALEEDGKFFWDKSYISFKEDSIFMVVEDKQSYICDSKFHNIEDGKWLIDIDGNKLIRDIILLPKSRIQVISKNNVFECKQDEIKFISFVSIIISEVKR